MTNKSAYICQKELEKDNKQEEVIITIKINQTYLAAINTHSYLFSARTAV